MNVVLRVATDDRSFILKQSRPYVQKYQDIKAPLERIEVEHAFYRAMSNSEVARKLPNVLHFDQSQNLLVLEDLGQCEDMIYVYNKRSIGEDQLIKLVGIVGAIHTRKEVESYPDNLELRRLNHQHIFELPFVQDNGFSLDEIQLGLDKLANEYKKESSIKSIAHRLGEKYLTPGDTLIHGDYYPGSWMSQKENIYVLDPEFSFLGFAEFDLGVMAGHLIMTTMERSVLDLILDHYNGKADQEIVNQVAGIEIMRRLIGLAQLPLNRSLDEKEHLLEEARKLITQS